jgi:glycosyltransferase involved in cell wall biosynthesis
VFDFESGPLIEYVSDEKSPKLVFGLTVPFSTILVGNMFSRMLDRGWQVHLFIGEAIPSTFPLDPRVHVHVIPMKRRISPLADLRALFRWYSSLKRLAPDICVGATPKAGMLSMISSKLARVPNRVYQVWGAKWDGLQGRTSWVLKKSDGLAAWCATETIACSQSMADLMVEAGVTSKRPTVLDHGGTKGVDLVTFYPAEGTNANHSGTPTIGFVGRLAKGKGVDLLLPLYRDLRLQFPSLVMEIVGETDSADPLPDGYLHELRAQPGITMHGHQTYVAEYFRRFDVLVFPSHREGLPNVVIEAAASGVPAVAWNVTGVRDAIQDGVSGFLVPHGDLEAMRSRILQILRNQSLRIELGNAAREFAVDRFSSQKVIEMQVDYFELLVNSNPKES